VSPPEPLRIELGVGEGGQPVDLVGAQEPGQDRHRGGEGTGRDEPDHPAGGHPGHRQDAENYRGHHRSGAEVGLQHDQRHRDRSDDQGQHDVDVAGLPLCVLAFGEQHGE